MRTYLILGLQLFFTLFCAYAFVYIFRFVYFLCVFSSITIFNYFTSGFGVYPCFHILVMLLNFISSIDVTNHDFNCRYALYSEPYVGRSQDDLCAMIVTILSRARRGVIIYVRLKTAPAAARRLKMHLCPCDHRSSDEGITQILNF